MNRIAYCTIPRVAIVSVTTAPATFAHGGPPARQTGILIGEQPSGSAPNETAASAARSQAAQVPTLPHPGAGASEPTRPGAQPGTRVSGHDPSASMKAVALIGLKTAGDVRGQRGGTRADQQPAQGSQGSGHGGVLGGGPLLLVRTQGG